MTILHWYNASNGQTNLSPPFHMIVDCCVGFRSILFHHMGQQTSILSLNPHLNFNTKHN